MHHTDRVEAWRPQVAGVSEVLHADWLDHRYPSHTHDTWTLLLVDTGAVGYGLDRHAHLIGPGLGVTVLPPHVVHDGRPASAAGFRKRVVYLDDHVVPARLIGSAVDRPTVADQSLRGLVSRMDRALTGGDDLAAESLLALVVDGIVRHLQGHPERSREPEPHPLAVRTRALLDADPTGIGDLTSVAGVLGVSLAHLVRSFSRTFSISPHQYLIGRRLDLARRLLLGGMGPAEVAVACGFHDQSHLHRHFRRLLSTTPGRYRAHVLRAAASHRST